MLTVECIGVYCITIILTLTVQLSRKLVESITAVGADIEPYLIGIIAAIGLLLVASLLIVGAIGCFCCRRKKAVMGKVCGLEGCCGNVSYEGAPDSYPNHSPFTEILSLLPSPLFCLPSSASLPLFFFPFSQLQQWEVERTLSILRTASASSSDDWEVDPNHVFMKEKLGEGSFGEVYRAHITKGIDCARAKRYVEDMTCKNKTATSCTVAVKLLKGEVN